MPIAKGKAEVVVGTFTVKISRGTRTKPYVIEYDKPDEGGHVQTVRYNLEDALAFVNHVLTHEAGLAE